MINGRTQLIGLIGWPVSHSFSPAMHNAAAAALGLNWVYVPLPVRPAELEAAVRGLAALGFRGVNVTVPHKERVIPLLDKVDPAARAIGAVNTIIIGDGGLAGYNFDWSGFLADLSDQGFEAEGQKCLVLGAGGSARAVVYALASAGGRVSVAARRPAQVESLIADLAPHLPGNRLAAIPWDERGATRPPVSDLALIVNTTPLGMIPNTADSPWPSGQPFPARALIYDLVYNPPQTTLLRQAKAAGCQTVSGLGMLLHQGVQAFELWTGEKADINVMVDALAPYLPKSTHS